MQYSGVVMRPAAQVLNLSICQQARVQVQVQVRQLQVVLVLVQEQVMQMGQQPLLKMSFTLHRPSALDVVALQLHLALTVRGSTSVMCAIPLSSWLGFTTPCACVWRRVCLNTCFPVFRQLDLPCTVLSHLSRH